MKLPHLEQAIVPPEKVKDYLLSETHPKGRFKAEFFKSFGFTSTNWQKLSEALVSHVREHGVVEEIASPFGVRYAIHLA